MFEPHPEVNCNVNEMFRCYGENYLSDYPEFEWAGFGIMNASDTKYGRGEPFYQFLAINITDVLLKNLQRYIKINPMHGYYTHIFVGYPNANEEKIK